ncbi:MAG: tryptophanase [Oligoflexia bacterium]|nr:tryptophanase [Oligoflexia bacterium]
MSSIRNNKPVFEPFKIKCVEPIPITTIEERQKVLSRSYYNLFQVPSNKVTFDFLTDSGTSAMSTKQWSAMMMGDESYAGSDSFFRFEKAIQRITDIEHIIPTHQGRSAEALLCKAILKKGMAVLGNTQFDTTRANIESSGCESVDIPCAEAQNSQAEHPFKGNVDLPLLEKILKDRHKQVPLFIMTVTNNAAGGQPVSLENIVNTKKILQKYNIPLFIDAARFAENAYFIKMREPEYRTHSILEITKKIFSHADGVLMSAKKDTFANIGGFIALRDNSLSDKIKTLMVVTEGFPTYGGLSGRDLDAIAVGIHEIIDEEYLKYRIRSIEYFGKGLEKIGFKIVKPLGGHAVYIDALASFPLFEKHFYPAHALSIALYERIGIRGVEVGSVMLGRKNEQTGLEEYADKELLRLAVPRRVYTQSHIDFILEEANDIFCDLSKMPGYQITYQAKYLRHFTAKFAPVSRRI